MGRILGIRKMAREASLEQVSLQRWQPTASMKRTALVERGGGRPIGRSNGEPRRVRAAALVFAAGSGRWTPVRAAEDPTACTSHLTWDAP